jgi:hypothetical protein
MELIMVSPELNKKENGPKSLAKGLLLDFVQRGVILTLVEVKSFIRKPYIHSYHEERDSNKPEFAGGISSGCHLL